MNILPDTEVQSILLDFPKFELSYENMIHKKVFNADIIMAIPDGKPCFAWFTSYKSDLVCFILEISENNRIDNVSIAITSFNDKLAFGTILYGTRFIGNGNGLKCMSIEDIYYYKGKNCISNNYLWKMDTLKYMFKNELSQTVLTNKYTLFGLPLMDTEFHSLLKAIELLPYKVKHIKFRFFENKNAKKILCMNYFKPGSNLQTQTQTSGYNSRNMVSKFVFKVTADIEPDIYNLWVYKNGKEEYYDVAHIPDYKTSVMMNKLFRNIKENSNLDALEESDNEDEFQDTREDKYVYLDRSFKMECEFNTRFKKWFPVRVADKTDKIVTWAQLR